MATQIEFNFPLPSKPQLKDIKLGECFQTADNSSIYMRVAPVKALVKSTMVHEVLARGDCFTVNIATGLFTVMKASTLVRPVDLLISVFSPVSSDSAFLS